MVAPLIIAAIIGAAGSVASSAMQAEAKKMEGLGKGPTPGGQFGLPGPTGTDKFTSTLRDLNEGGDKSRPPLFAPGHAPDDFLSPGKGYTEDQIKPKQLFSDQATAEQAKARGNLGAQMAAAEQAPRPEALEGHGIGAKKGGFDADQTMQYAAMAAQLGSMLAGPPAPPPPGRVGGGSFNYQPVTMRSVFGG